MNKDFLQSTYMRRFASMSWTNRTYLNDSCSGKDNMETKPQTFSEIFSV